MQDQILKAILPDELHEDLPSSFTIVGHIGKPGIFHVYRTYRMFLTAAVLASCLPTPSQPTSTSARTTCPTSASSGASSSTRARACAQS